MRVKTILFGGMMALGILTGSFIVSGEPNWEAGTLVLIVSLFLALIS